MKQRRIDGAFILTGLLGLTFLGVLLYSCGYAYHKVRINVPGCGVSMVRMESGCEKPQPHYPEGVEVLCHDFVMTPTGPVAVDRIVVYHCIKAKL